MKNTASIFVAAVIAAPLFLAAEEKAADKKKDAPAGPARAVAVLQAAAGGPVAGVVRFRKSGDAVAVSARITGLTPGPHGFHVHEFGDCSAADFASAGAHFNPMNHPHAAREAGERHVGDLGNVQAGTDGVAMLEWTDKEVALDGHHSVIGRAVVVHAKPDDLKTQPSGDAGGRLACGVIGIAKTE